MNARNCWTVVPCVGQLSRQSEMSVLDSPVISTIFLNNNTFPPARVNNRATTRSPGRPLILSFIRLYLDTLIISSMDHFTGCSYLIPVMTDHELIIDTYFHCFSVFYYECVSLFNKYKILMIHLYREAFKNKHCAVFVSCSERLSRNSDNCMLHGTC